MVAMLWDMSPLSYWPPSPQADQCRHAFVGMLARVLNDVPSLACKESALHGLGHFGPAPRDEAEATIQQWLARRPMVPEALIDYARQAATGAIM